MLWQNVSYVVQTLGMQIYIYTHRYIKSRGVTNYQSETRPVASSMGWAELSGFLGLEHQLLTPHYVSDQTPEELITSL